MWGEGAAFAAVLVGGADGAMAEAIALAGGRVQARLGWGEEPPYAPDALLVLDASDRVGDLPDLAERADVVCCTLAQLDAGADALLFTDAQLLCDPTMAERIAALAVAAGLANADTAPLVRDTDRARLKRFSGEVARIAGVLSRLASEESGGEVADRPVGFTVEPGTAEPNDPPADPQTIRAALRARRLRDGFFGPGLFEDPAWDMLLDLHAAELEGARVSVSSLCIAAAVAPTTALRWIGRLVANGLIERRPDPRDRRRAFVALSGRGSTAMQRYLAALTRQGLSLG